MIITIWFGPSSGFFLSGFMLLWWWEKKKKRKCEEIQRSSDVDSGDIKTTPATGSLGNSLRYIILIEQREPKEKGREFGGG